VEEMGNAINKMNRVNKELTNRLRRQPSIEELANELQTTPKNVMDMQKAAQLEYSFNMPVDDGGAHEFGESIEDENQKPEADATRNLFSEDMANILHGLLPLELLVLQLRFGLLDGISRNIAEVGRELHIRQERVKSVEFKALYRLAHGRYRDLLLQYYGNEHPTKDIDDEPEE
jgi:RNA polymerase primary sigma factor